MRPTPVAVQGTVAVAPDPYPRTPFRIRLTGNESYTMPAGQTLVIETLNVDLLCGTGTTTSATASLGLTAGTNYMLVQIPLQATPGFPLYTALISARLSLPSGVVVQKFTDLVGCGITYPDDLSIFGYLVSSSSPSLAP